MTRAEVSDTIRKAATLAECHAAAHLLRDYLQAHPDDDDLRDEGSGLYMKLTALEQTLAAFTPGPQSQAERAA